MKIHRKTAELRIFKMYMKLIDATVKYTTAKLWQIIKEKDYTGLKEVHEVFTVSN